MLASRTGWIQASKIYFHLLITTFRPRRCLCRDPSFGIESKVVSSKRWVRQAKLFQRRFESWLVQCSRSAFFLSLSLPSPDVSCLLNDTALYPLPLIWTVSPKSFVKRGNVWDLFGRGSFTSLTRWGSLFVWFRCLFSRWVSLLQSQPNSLRALLWLPLSPGTDRGRITARDQPRHTSASSATPSALTTPSQSHTSICDWTEGRHARPIFSSFNSHAPIIRPCHP